MLCVFLQFIEFGIKFLFVIYLQFEQRTEDNSQAPHLGAKGFKRSLGTFDLGYFVNLLALDSD